MKNITSLFLLLFFTTSQALASNSCSDAFRDQSPLFLTEKILDLEIAPLFRTFSLAEVNDIVMQTARGELNNGWFSDRVVTGLQNTLHHVIQAELLSNVVQRPFVNEQKRRHGQPVKSSRETFGMDLSPEKFGIEDTFTPSKEVLENLSESHLNSLASTVVDTATTLYLAQVRNSEPFLDIGIRFDTQKYFAASQNNRNNLSSSVQFLNLTTPDGLLKGEGVIEPTTVLLRESLIREDIEIALSEGRLRDWPQDPKLSDLQILLMALHPELLPYAHKITSLAFREAISVHNRIIGNQSSYSPLKGAPQLLVNFHLSHENVPYNHPHRGTTITTIQIHPIYSRSEDWTPFSKSDHKRIPSLLDSLWTDFLRKRGLRSQDVEIEALYDPITSDMFSVYIRPQLKSLDALGLSIDFFNFMTTGKKVNAWNESYDPLSFSN